MKSSLLHHLTAIVSNANANSLLHDGKMDHSLSVNVRRRAEMEGAQRDAGDSGRLKTKVRRLYDIANILASLRLLAKTQQPDSRKPAFRWLAPETVSEAGLPATLPGATLKRFYRRAPVAACLARRSCRRHCSGVGNGMLVLMSV